MKQHRLTPYALLLITAGMSVTSYALAEDQLNEIKVEDSAIQSGAAESQTVRKTHKAIQQEMIRDTRDLVRYTTDVGVADNGRRLKGFSMRGVEGNRVGISIDGVSLPDFEENSLYARYGNFNNSRLSIDSEMVRSIDIVKGSDSVNMGSGYLGGGVNYRTMNVEDLVFSGKSVGGLLRSGYASKNREWVNTAGVGFTNDDIDLVLMYSHRQGHEFKSAGGNVTPRAASRYDSAYETARRAEIGEARIHPDPSNHKNDSYLAKLTWKINPQHKLGISINGQRGSRYTWEYSYGMQTSWREADDYERRFNGNIFYEWKADKNPIIGLVRTDLDYQKIENGAINYKGTYDAHGGWRDRTYTKGALQNVDNRNMKTEYKRATLRVDSQPFSFIGGDHVLSFRTYVAQRDFKNINNDKVLKPDGSVSTGRIYTIQRPVKTAQYGFSLKNDTFWNDTFSSFLGVRYDYEKLKPQSYSDGIPCTAACLRAEERNQPKETKFSNWNGFIGLDAQINPTWKVGYQLGTGYRVPTATEIFFTYDNPAGNWKANPNLKAERSLSHTIYAQAKNNIGMLDANFYYTKYHNFLFEQETTDMYYEPLCSDDQDGLYCNKWKPAPFQQMVNLDSARIYGLEIKGSLNLHEVSPLPEGFKLSSGIGYSKGKLSNNDSLLSIQPLKLMFGLDYEEPNEKWGVFSRVTYHRGKKGGDAKITETDSDCIDENDLGLCRKWEDIVTHREYRWLNKSYWVFDLFGYYRPVKNVTLRAGVYNLFDKKYHTWDSLRGINYRSTINSVDYRHGNQGLERFYAPGRNFSASVEIRF
ncbi:TonB-dependent hemoglobin/transferrin/lactoferrin family receptor [Haemophilus haemolyticus]|uniref:TonB-dependent hemoglobin/transferrin/lactoferrin family receptor n=1 Tax=Haemophilus haemolyticus TaxID=726 RepID=UPI000E579450|nr:TonB-dependent hemoglobin/transferrin/lactoferrin family receptor [Haemophilus haemolyticus]